jgi:hypothetical protein
MPIPQVPQVKDEINAELSFRFSSYTKNAVVLVLRSAFAHHFTPPQYRYANQPNSPAYDGPNPEIQPDTRGIVGSRQIGIYRAFPRRSVMYPMMYVDTEPGDVSITTLNDEEAYEVYDEDPDSPTYGVLLGINHAGVMSIPVVINIRADKPVDRDKITDMVLIYARFAFKKKFERENLPFLDIQGGNDGEEEVPGVGLVFKGKVTIMMQTQFDQFISQGLLDVIESINISGVQVGSKAEDMQSVYEE